MEKIEFEIKDIIEIMVVGQKTTIILRKNDDIYYMELPTAIRKVGPKERSEMAPISKT